LCDPALEPYWRDLATLMAAQFDRIVSAQHDD
jgi:hypothetical protein